MSTGASTQKRKVLTTDEILDPLMALDIDPVLQSNIYRVVKSHQEVATQNRVLMTLLIACMEKSALAGNVSMLEDSKVGVSVSKDIMEKVKDKLKKDYPKICVGDGSEDAVVISISFDS